MKDKDKVTLYFAGDEIVLTLDQYREVENMIENKRGLVAEGLYYEHRNDAVFDMEDYIGEIEDRFTESDAIHGLINIAEEYEASVGLTYLEKIVFGLNFIPLGYLDTCDGPDIYFTPREFELPLKKDLETLLTTTQKHVDAAIQKHEEKEQEQRELSMQHTTPKGKFKNIR